MKFSIKRIQSGSRWLFLPLLLMLASHTSATVTQPLALLDASPRHEAQYYDSTPKKGWYWYHDPAVQPEKPDEQKPAIMEQQVPENRKYTKEELYDMYPDQFQELLKVRMKTAVQYPTEEYVAEYLTMQDIARRKAAAFSSAVQFVTQKDAATLSVNDVYPTAIPGSEARTQMKEKEIQDTIAAAKDNHAILFFWKPGCSFCDKQVGILKYFTEKYGWQIKPINIQEQTGIAARFNITSTPTLLLIRQGGEQYLPISVGVVSLSEMELKSYQAIRYLNGDTQIDTFTNSNFEKGGSLDPSAILKIKQPSTTPP